MPLLLASPSWVSCECPSSPDLGLVASPLPWQAQLSSEPHCFFSLALLQTLPPTRSLPPPDPTELHVLISVSPGEPHWPRSQQAGSLGPSLCSLTSTAGKSPALPSCLRSCLYGPAAASFLTWPSTLISGIIPPIHPLPGLSGVFPHFPLPFPAPPWLPSTHQKKPLLSLPPVGWRPCEVWPARHVQSQLLPPPSVLLFVIGALWLCCSFRLDRSYTEPVEREVHPPRMLLPISQDFALVWPWTSLRGLPG